MIVYHMENCITEITHILDTMEFPAVDIDMNSIVLL